MKPLFMTPCYGGNVMANFANSLLALNNAMWQTGMQGSVRIRSGESLITRARNEAVAEFLLDPGYTHLFWIDADIGFSVDQVLRLLLADRNVVAGVYPLKRFDWPGVLPGGLTQETFAARYLRYPVNAHDGVSPAIDGDGFLEVSEAPTGFMCIKRGAIETMIDAPARTEVRARRSAGFAALRSLLPLLRCDGRAFHGPLSVGRLCVLPTLAGYRRAGIRRYAIEAVASGHLHVARRFRRVDCGESADGDRRRVLTRNGPDA